MPPLLVIALLLAFVGGYADAASFLLTSTFTGHVTGNTVLLMIHAAQGAWRGAASNASAIAAFLAGTEAAEWIGTGAGAPRHARQMRAPLLIEGALLLAATASRLRAGPLGNDLSVVFMCLALGLQNGAMSKCGAISFHTTFITGMSTNLLATTVRRPPQEEKPGDRPEHAPGVPALVLLAFAGGAGASGWLVGEFKVWGFAGIFVPLAAALFVAARAD